VGALGGAAQAEHQRHLRLELESEVGHGGTHRRLVGELALEDRAVADVVQRLAQRNARLAGRGDGAVEAREVHHLDDGAHTRALRAYALGIGAMELDLGRGIRLVAELVLQPLEADLVLRSIRPIARHQIAGQTAFGLGQHQEGIAHRRRHEPFVAGDLDMIAGRDGAGDVGAHVGAALALGHAHAERDAVLLPPRQGPRIVGAGLDPGQPLRQQRRLRAQRADAGMGHGDGAHVAALGLGREIEPHRARRGRTRLVAAVVRRGMDAVADALGHHGVVGGMELDQVQPIALAIDEVELGRVLVGDAAEIERGRRTIILAAGRQVREIEPGTRRRIGQRPIGTEQIDIAERRRLVERGVFEQAGGHG
jgi:hypothetical protein